MVNFFSKGKWQRALASALGCAALALVAFQLGYATVALVLLVLASLDLGMTYLRLRNGAPAVNELADRHEEPADTEITQSTDVADDKAEPARKTRSFTLPSILSRGRARKEADAPAKITGPEISALKETQPVDAIGQQDEVVPPKKSKLGAIKLPKFGMSFTKDGGATKLAEDDPFERFARRMAEGKAREGGKRHAA